MDRRMLSGVLFAMIFALGPPRWVMAAVTVSINPSGNVLVPVGEVRQFTATVTSTVKKTVTWSLTPPAGVRASLIGTISSTGRYTAPANPLPNFASLTVTATSVANPRVRASALVTVSNPIPSTTSLTPNSVPIGPFNLAVSGSRFVSGARILLNGSPLTTQFVSSTQLNATGSASTVGPSNITVANPGPGAVSSPPLVLSVNSNLAVTVTPATASLPPNGTRQFQAKVSGSANQAVSWSVIGGLGSITSFGVYTAPSDPPVGGTITVQALAAADGVTKGTATVTIHESPDIATGRFLEQATYGPTTALIAHVKQNGPSAFIAEQFAMPESPWPSLATATRADAVDAFFGNAFKGSDQIRQRVIGVLSEFIVEAMNKNTNGNEIVPWLQVLSRNAFGNYRNLLEEITLDASMGKYLDLANSGIGGTAPNENYPREMMQLFSIGLQMLNPDGTPQVDGSGVPIPTYTQNDVREVAKALTGWTYSNASGTSGSGGNWNYYPGPMIPVSGAHNTQVKTVLGQSIPANQSARQDLDAVIDILFNHPNLGPFLATRLIHGLVTSNPTPQYVSRVAAVFNGGTGDVRGDMKATIKAILLDPEARDDTVTRTGGRLRTPMQHTAALCRALGIDPGPASQFAYLFYGMDEALLDAPSVFGHYSPFYRIPHTSLIGPEFQIYSASDAVNRANFFFSLIYSSWPINPALQPFVSAASDASALITTIDNTLLFGRMTPTTRNAILNAVTAQYDNNQRVLAALYLVFTSGEYLVQH